MKKTVKKIVATFALIFVLTPLTFVSSNNNFPAIPVMYYGDVAIDGSSAVVGTVVSAYNSSGTEIATTTLSKEGSYYINISEDDGIDYGESITFKINGSVATTADMEDSSDAPSVEVDLSITTTPASSSSSGGGGVPSNNNKNDNKEEEEDSDSSESESDDIDDDEGGTVKGATSVKIGDGDIVQCQNSENPYAVYIVKIVNDKKYIRHIVSLDIFNYYSHLKWENLIQIDSLEGFSLSGWVRVNTGENGMPGASDKVWEINGDQTRHWINMTAEEFIAHGGSEEAIYSINQGELEMYKEGDPVVLQ